jgi:hypothetical protein
MARAHNQGGAHVRSGPKRHMKRGPSIPTDPYWEFVKLLVYGEGADGTNTFADRSPVGRALTAAGNVQHDTGIDLQGQSILFDGSGDFISAADSADMRIGTSTDFCLEAFVRLGAGTNLTISSKRDGTGAEEHTFGISSTGKLFLQTFGSGVLRANCVGATTLSTGVNYHVAASRAGTTARVFVNGVLDATATQSGTVDANTESFKIGRQTYDTAKDYNGSLNWFRFTRGHARYTAGFSVPATPFPQA